MTRKSTHDTARRSAATVRTGEADGRVARIAKVMARAGLCSRREAEGWIAAGRVAVNGTTITSPALNVGPHDRVMVDGAPLPSRERTRLFLYHKPRGLLTTRSDLQGRPTIFGALPKDLPRLVSVGRLDFNTEGLMLLTNDGGLARVLELPETGWLRRYRVRAHGRITQAELDRLREGITVEGMRYGPIIATVDRSQASNVWLTVAIREGKNREVRKVLDQLGLSVNRLIRVSFGPFQLGELPEGGVEEVRTRMLRDQLGERLAARIDADFAAPKRERRAEPYEEAKRDSREMPEKFPGQRPVRGGLASKHPERRIQKSAPATKAPRNRREQPHRKPGSPRPARPRGR